MSDPNSRQVGGNHYAAGGALQHWDLVENYGLGYLEGYATKYIARHRLKNGAEDLRKADHCVEKMIQLATELGRKPRGCVPDEVLCGFCNAHSLGKNATFCMSALTGYWSPGLLQEVRTCLQDMIRDYTRGIQDSQPENLQLAAIDTVRAGINLEGSEPR